MNWLAPFKMESGETVATVINVENREKGGGGVIYFLAIVIFAMAFMILHEIKKWFIFRQVKDLRQFVALKVVLLFAIQILCAVYVVIHT